jgi:hypothetical protein
LRETEVVAIIVVDGEQGSPIRARVSIGGKERSETIIKDGQAGFRGAEYNHR